MAAGRHVRCPVPGQLRKEAIALLIVHLGSQPNGRTLSFTRQNRDAIRADRPLDDDRTRDIRSHAGAVGVKYPSEHEGRCEAWPSAATCFSQDARLSTVFARRSRCATRRRQQGTRGRGRSRPSADRWQAPVQGSLLYGGHRSPRCRWSRARAVLSTQTDIPIAVDAGAGPLGPARDRRGSATDGREVHCGSR